MSIISDSAPLSDLSVVKSVSLTSALEKELERLILTGELEPGVRINEIHLSNRFGTSRGPIREATRSLEAKGLVEVVRNRGVFVRRLSVEDAVEIYDVRAALFGQAGRLLAERMTDGLLAELTRMVDEMDAVAERGSFDEYYPLNLGFHNLIVSSCGNRTLLAEYHRFVNKLHLFRARALVQGGGLAVSNREHRAMLEALASGDGDRAQMTHWRHVALAKRRLIAAVDGHARND
ncbi:FCD domain-containing protein [Ancylobacter dichloromethanicus]|uniref:GntR family transcriptional regulator n=1 Tax=Ancylobacter dichloromethanicus TaxID=518825 RepID=A0A9W6MXF6_9HYPH|nr:FCD domain-containing protein [Ancylobacter dichloromethanicus]MBS7556227.1 FCD domain-containing protein [Ancylobacter dichloromethanicus]GLK69986.1 GntR family transcriptional regulator [Ancylobacter dichloromethanicus]